jgi:hypothetical protein
MTPSQLSKLYGSPIQIAAAIGKHPITIQRWINANKIPYMAQLNIQAITQGKLKACRTQPKEKI